MQILVHASVKGFFTYIPSMINININTCFLISLKLTMIVVGGIYPNPKPDPSAPLKQVIGPVYKKDACLT